MTGPNPDRVGACEHCGSYRADGRPPWLHHPGCPREDDPQAERAARERATGDRNGPTLWASPEHKARAEEALAMLARWKT